MAEETKNQPIQFGKVTNPTVDNLHFEYDSAPYILKAGETEDRWPAYLAKHAAKKLADKNIMTNDPEEHRVLMGAYLENSDPEVIAKRLGIDLNRIRKEAMTKEKAKSRVINLEVQMLEMKKELKEMKEMKEIVAKEAGEVVEALKDKAPEKEPEVKVKVEKPKKVAKKSKEK